MRTCENCIHDDGIKKGICKKGVSFPFHLWRGNKSFYRHTLGENGCRFFYGKNVLGEYDIKPWEDEDSLFCSPMLKKIIGKEPLKGDECKTV